MDLLFLNRCYWPDVEATGQLLTELCGDLARRHHVTVIAGQPNFVQVSSQRLIQRETHEGVQIVRVRNSRFSKRSFAGRVFGLSGYLLLATWSAFTQRRPAHGTMRVTGLDGHKRTVETTALPLFGPDGEFHGIMAIFWELG